MGTLNIFRSICNAVRLCQTFGMSGVGLNSETRYATARQFVLKETFI
jgi:hypothetical protein